MVIKYKSFSDSVTGDPLVQKFGNLLMCNGKKTKAELIVKKMFIHLHNNYPGQALNILYLAIFNSQKLSDIKLKLQGKKLRRNNSPKNLGIPYFIRVNRGYNISIRSIFLLGYNSRLNKPLWYNLSQEILLAATNKSGVMSKSLDSHIKSRLNRRQYNYRFRRKLPMDYERAFLVENSTSKIIQGTEKS